MKSWIIAATLFLFSAVAFSQSKQSNASYIKDTLYPAVGLLYSQDAEGTLNMHCTVTAIERDTDGKTEFLTAAHCGCEDNPDKKTVSPKKDVVFYVTSDDPEDKEFEKAEVVGCGYRTRGDDFMFLTAKSKKSFTTVSLGHDPELLDEVINVASPLGLGKETFVGTVASPKLERPVIDGDIDWQGVITLQMFGVNGGSSGSAVVCLNQRAICGTIVGSIGETTITAMPVSRLIEVKKGIDAGTYKYWVKDPDAPPATPTKPTVSK